MTIAAIRDRLRTRLGMMGYFAHSHSWRVKTMKSTPPIVHMTMKEAETVSRALVSLNRWLARTGLVSIDRVVDQSERQEDQGK